jgi:uncharacterized protein
MSKQTERSFSMIANLLSRPVRAALVALAVATLAPSAQAQQPAPSANALALAKEIIVLKGSSAGFDSVGPAVIDKVRLLFLQTSPMLSKDLNEVAAKLRTDYAARFAQPLNDAAKVYASRFNEQELKDVLAFYKTPAGKKVIEEEPLIFQESMTNLDQWASTLSEEIINKMRAEMKKRGHDI